MKRATAVFLITSWSLAGTGSHAESTAMSVAQPSEHKSTITSNLDLLLSVQDSAAAGNHQAAEEQKQILERITKALKTMPEDQLSAFVEQTVAYVLSGGDPGVADRLSRASGLSNEEQTMLRASAAFMDGNSELAKQLFMKIEPVELSARLAGRVALAKALLSKNREQQYYFSVAMASMPGTLIEESSLRRSALAYADARDERNMLKILDRYARRFPSSVYAENFWRDIVVSLTAWAMKDPGPQLEKLDNIIGMLPRGQRQQIYLALARASAAQGLPEPTGFAGRRLYRIAVEGSAESQLGRFYVNLFGIVTPEGDGALSQLRTIRREALGPQERSLLDAAMSLGMQIERPASVMALLSEEPQEESTLLVRGRELLSHSYDVLTELN